MTQRSFATSAAKTGRPVGCRPKPNPQTLPEFVTQALSEHLTPPPPPAPPPKTPGKAGIWSSMTPEERSVHAKHLASLRKPENMKRDTRRTGTPNGWNHQSAAVARTAARIQATEMVDKMKSQGLIDPQDAEGIEATIDALTVLASPGSNAKRVKAAKRLLRFYAPEHASLI
jgi:hypothetical protein